MKASYAMHRRVLAAVAVVSLGMIGYVWAQAPAPPPVSPPTTLWNFLGIPQGTHKIQDALINPRGNHPKLERKPALKQIADPANLQSPNAAIKVAAEAKADADLAPQKIKALKFLATVCCGCAKNKAEVQEAFMAALDDCTEEVRYEAAIAVCECSGNPCTTCNGGSCCDAKLMNKLLKMSEGKDAQGCWLESSARVRAAAANAPSACRDVRGPQAAPEQRKGGEFPGEVPTLENKTPAKPGVPKPEDTTESSAMGVRIQARPVGYAQAGQRAEGNGPGADAGVTVSDDPASLLACRERLFGGRLCPFGRLRERYVPGEEGAAPTPGLPEDKVPGATPPEDVTPPEFGGASPTGLARGTVMGGVPNMIGDIFFSNGYFTIQREVTPYDEFQANVPIAGGDRRHKVADDNNPIPTDRFFCNYNGYSNALVGADDVARDFNRFTFGLEKTFCDGQASLEFRIPFGGGLNSTQSTAAGAPLMATEFGNVPVVFKAILWQCPHQLVAAGVAGIFPMGSDGRLTDSLGETVVSVSNDAFHVQPFVAWLWTPPERRVFVQLFAQVDIDANGNEVFLRDFRQGDLLSAGRLQDQSLLFLDLKLGYWLHDNPNARLITGVVPTVEIHYNATLQDADEAGGVTNPFNHVNVLDLTAGVHFMLGEKTTITVAGAVPLRRHEDSLFDAELAVYFNRSF